MDPVKVVLAPSATAPVRQSEWASGYDLHALVPSEFQYINPHSWSVVSTGVSVEIPNGWEAQVRPRSSMTLAGLIMPLGTIDSDYRGEVKVMIYNTGNQPYRLSHGQRIAQLVFQAVCQPRIMVVDSLSSTDRGAGGFGSTGR